MDNTQFAMIEELASLIKDNLYSKHLVLSIEEALVTLLQQRYHDDDDEEEHDRAATGARHGPAGNTIELQPTSSYNRLLLHRLADIYGFAHESVGEGEDRHLVLQRCPETAIPPVLVSDVLWNYDDSDGPSASLMLARNETDLQKTHEPEDVQNAISLESLHLKTDTPVSKPLQQSVPPSAASLKEREAAYRAARERIFSSHEAKGNDTSAAKSRHVPAVAQRMIAHALGKRVEDPTERAALVKGKELVNGRTSPTSKEAVKHNSSSPDGGPYRNPSTRSRPTPTVSAETLKKEQTGAAKRMFAHALRLPGVEIPNGAARKPK
ncbi:hypothetical protein CFC21_046002 [Triticum aestivum]|uniref:R3H domain-containing protein n=2 Tax=Triticum aestivum TaxID=4565 RepID=A0A9R1FVT8_WHEAT|nr:uncharacterized protein LOC123077241 [Triticum aestivum]KAF7035072.1 hypothetical protein CFC21_046002 [Triticum aestivum]